MRQHCCIVLAKQYIPRMNAKQEERLSRAPVSLAHVKNDVMMLPVWGLGHSASQRSAAPEALIFIGSSSSEAKRHLVRGPAVKAILGGARRPIDVQIVHECT